MDTFDQILEWSLRVMGTDSSLPFSPCSPAGASQIVPGKIPKGGSQGWSPFLLGMLLLVAALILPALACIFLGRRKERKDPERDPFLLVQALCLVYFFYCVLAILTLFFC